MDKKIKRGLYIGFWAKLIYGTKIYLPRLKKNTNKNFQMKLFLAATEGQQLKSH